MKPFILPQKNKAARVTGIDERCSAGWGILQTLQEPFVAMENGETIFRIIIIIANLSIDIIKARFSYCYYTLFNIEVVLNIIFVGRTWFSNINIAFVV